MAWRPHVPGVSSLCSATCCLWLSAGLHLTFASGLTGELCATSFTSRCVRRLVDLLDDDAVALHAVACAAVDECDKMLSLGFRPQLDRLAAALLPPLKPLGSGDRGIGDADAQATEAEPLQKKKKHRRDGDSLLVPAVATAEQRRAAAGFPDLRHDIGRDEDRGEGVARARCAARRGEGLRRR
jgi:hypothetical protein